MSKTEEKAKLTKQMFRDEFYELMAEFTADQELLVRVEGIDMYIEYIQFVTKEDLQKDLIPHLVETL